MLGLRGTQTNGTMYQGLDYRVARTTPIPHPTFPKARVQWPQMCYLISSHTLWRSNCYQPWIVRIGFVEVKEPSLPWLRPRGHWWEDWDNKMQQGTQEVRAGAQRPQGSVSHLCIRSSHPLKTQGPAVGGSHVFSHHRENGSFSDGSDVHPCGQRHGAQIGPAPVRCHACQPMSYIARGGDGIK